MSSILILCQARLGHCRHAAHPPHTILDPCSSEDGHPKPPMPLCVSILGGHLEEGTLMALDGTPNQILQPTLQHRFIVENASTPTV
ncbi:hypothetical protein TYRP_022900 [Tyrophagus putrescentiae]|nr:hypothetical protein TYRP_022900 [Tyrophagus putrescentiae]